MKMQQKEEISNVTELKLLLGGKQPPKKGDNWLSKLNLWSIFTARCLSLSKVDLFLFQVRDKYDNGTCLILFLPKEEPIIKYVSTIDFSNEYELFDILEDGDDFSDRSNTIRGLEINEKLKTDDTLAGETG